MKTSNPRDRVVKAVELAVNEFRKETGISIEKMTFSHEYDLDNPKDGGSMKCWVIEFANRW